MTESKSGFFTQMCEQNPQFFNVQSWKKNAAAFAVNDSGSIERGEYKFTLPAADFYL